MYTYLKSVSVISMGVFKVAVYDLIGLLSLVVGTRGFRLNFWIEFLVRDA